MKILIIILITLTFSSCRYGVTYSGLSELKEKKEKVETTLNSDLNIESQKILRDYFKGVKEVVYDLSSNSSMQSYMHRKFFRYFSQQMCADSVLSKKQYDTIMSKCNVSGFYICSEEVRSYSAILRTAASYLTGSELSALKKDESCKKNLLALGAINE